EYTCRQRYLGSRRTIDAGCSSTFGKSVVCPPCPRQQHNLFRRYGRRSLTHFLQVSQFYPLFLDSRKIFEGVGMADFHTFFASQSFYLLVLDKKDKEIIRRMTESRLPYGLRFWP